MILVSIFVLFVGGIYYIALIVLAFVVLLLVSCDIVLVAASLFPVVEYFHEVVGGIDCYVVEL